MDMHEIVGNNCPAAEVSRDPAMRGGPSSNPMPEYPGRAGGGEGTRQRYEPARAGFQMFALSWPAVATQQVEADFAKARPGRKRVRGAQRADEHGQAPVALAKNWAPGEQRV